MRTSRRGTTISWASSPQESIPDQWPMSKEEFHLACTDLGIKDGGTAGEVFGLSARTCQRYWYGELTIPGPLARLLRFAVRQEVTVKDMRKLSRPIVLKDTRQSRQAAV